MSHNKSSSCKAIYEDPAAYSASFKKDCSYHNSTANTLFEYDNLVTAKASAADVWANNMPSDQLDKKMLKNEMECM